MRSQGLGATMGRLNQTEVEEMWSIAVGGVFDERNYTVCFSENGADGPFADTGLFMFGQVKYFELIFCRYSHQVDLLIHAPKATHTSIQRANIESLNSKEFLQKRISGLTINNQVCIPIDILKAKYAVPKSSLSLTQWIMPQSLSDGRVLYLANLTDEQIAFTRPPNTGAFSIGDAIALISTQVRGREKNE